MSRERDRIAKKREKNPIEECNKIQKRFYPELFSKFGQIKDPRNSSYITYSTKEMLGSLYYKGIAGISSMRAMTEAFNNEQVTRNLYQFMDGKEKEYLKTFDDAKIPEKWHILVDGEEKQLNSEKG